METITLRAFLKKNVCFKKAVLLLYNIDIRRADQIYDCPSPKIKIPLPNVHSTCNKVFDSPENFISLLI